MFQLFFVVVELFLFTCPSALNRYSTLVMLSSNSESLGKQIFSIITLGNHDNDRVDCYIKPKTSCLLFLEYILLSLSGRYTGTSSVLFTLNVTQICLYAQSHMCKLANVNVTKQMLIMRPYYVKTLNVNKQKRNRAGGVCVFRFTILAGFVLYYL